MPSLLPVPIDSVGVMDSRRAAAGMAALGALSIINTMLSDLYDRKQRSIGVNLRLNDRVRGPAWVEDCIGNLTQLYEETRLCPEVWQELVGYLQNGLVSDGNIGVEEKLLTFLYICSNGASFRNCRRKVGRSMETISRNFHEVLNALLFLYKDVVKGPSPEIPERIKDNLKYWPYFKDCVGAIDGTHIPIFVPERLHKRYRNRYGDLTQNVLAAVDFNMNFIYILAGWEGSGKVLRDAYLKGFSAPAGKYFVADAGYTKSDQLLTPYRGVRYHLREIREVGRDARTPQELFNYRHSSLRNVVERTFGVFKRRWRIFDRPHEFAIETQSKLVYALAAIHNLINSVSAVGVDEDPEAYEREELDKAQRDSENLHNLTARDVSANIGDTRDRLAEDIWSDQQRARQLLERDWGWSRDNSASRAGGVLFTLTLALLAGNKQRFDVYTRATLLNTRQRTSHYRQSWQLCKR